MVVGMSGPNSTAWAGRHDLVRHAVAGEVVTYGHVVPSKVHRTTAAGPSPAASRYRNPLAMTAASKPILFLLRSGFPDPQHGPGGFFCPECATIAGLLYYYPQLTQQIDVRQVDAPRPRPEVVALVGEEHQSCPVLVLPEGDRPAGLPLANGRAFVSGPAAIVNFLADRYGTARSH